MDQSLVIGTWVMAFGTLLLAILALFGVSIRPLVFRPKLTIRLNNKTGKLVQWDNGTRGIYYHLKIENHGWSTAKNVRVLITGISKRLPGAAFTQAPMAAPERLMWRFSQVFGLTRDIPTGFVGKVGEICDLGFVNEGSNIFQVIPYAVTVSFPGYLKANEGLQLNLVVTADNFSSEKSYDLQISWDGQWFENLHEMQKHLVIEELNQGKT